MLGVMNAWAQDSVSVSLSDCLQNARINHVKLQNAALAMDVAAADKNIALSKYFPTLTANAGYFHSLYPIINLNSRESGADVDARVTYNGISVSGNTIEDLIRQEFGDLINNLSVDVTIKMLNDGAYAGLFLTQPIFVGGRIVNGNKLAQLGVDVAELRLAMTEKEILINTESNYYRVVALREKERTLKQALMLVDTLMKDAEAAHGAGVIGKNDLLKVRLKHSELLALQTQLNNGVELAMRDLLQDVGMTYCDTCLYIIDSMAIDSIVTDPTLNISKELSISNREEMRLLDAAVKAEELKKNMIIGQGLPQVALTVTYGMNNLFGNNFSHNGLAMVSATLPITGRWENYREYQKQEIAQQIAENNRNYYGEKLQLQDQQLRNALFESWQLLQIKKQAVSDAKENLEEMRSYYQAGMVSTSDFLEAQSLLQQVQNECIDQAIAYRMAWSRYRMICE